MLDKVTRWLSCDPDSIMARSEGHVPLQLSSKDQTGGSLFLWP